MLTSSSASADTCPLCWQAISLVDTITPEVAAAAASLSTTARKSADSSASSADAKTAPAFKRLCSLLHLYFLADPSGAEPDLAADIGGVVADALAAKSAGG